MRSAGYFKHIVDISDKKVKELGQTNSFGKISVINFRVIVLCLLALLILIQFNFLTILLD